MWLGTYREPWEPLTGTFALRGNLNSPGSTGRPHIQGHLGNRNVGWMGIRAGGYREWIWKELGEGGGVNRTPCRELKRAGF